MRKLRTGTAASLWEATPPNGHDDFTRAGENQLSSSELFHGELARARLIIATPWHSKLARPDSKLFCNTSDTNRSADKQTRPPLALFHVLGQPVKLLGLLVDRLSLHLCKLSRLSTRQKQNYNSPSSSVAAL